MEVEGEAVVVDADSHTDSVIKNGECDAVDRDQEAAGAVEDIEGACADRSQQSPMEDAPEVPAKICPPRFTLASPVEVYSFASQCYHEQ